MRIDKYLQKNVPSYFRLIIKRKKMHEELRGVSTFLIHSKGGGGSSGNGDEAREGMEELVDEGMEEWWMKGWRKEERRIRAEQPFRALPGAAVD